MNIEKCGSQYKLQEDCLSELFDDDDKIIIEDEAIIEDALLEVRQKQDFDARRRLERLMEEKRLRSELDDLLDYIRD